MLGKGTKRKRDEGADGAELGAELPSLSPSKLSYALQRQTVLNLSLMKLYQQGAPAEPRLQRCVLVSNVLRRILEELRREGGPQALLLPSPANPSRDDPLDEGFREVPPSSPVATPLSLPPPRSPTPLDSCLMPASLLEDDTPVFCTLAPPCPVPRAPLRTVPSAPLNAEELCPVQSAAAVAPPPTMPPPPTHPVHLEQRDIDRASGQWRRGGVTVETLSFGCLDASSSSFLADLTLDDILFADIDTSMYDFDLCSSAWGGGATSRVSPDDLVKNPSPCGAGSVPVGSNQPFRPDLSELDHIMEVLVGS